MSTLDSTIGAFQDFIQNQSFPCVAAKSALATGGMRLLTGNDMRDRRADLSLLSALQTAPKAPEQTHELASTIILFPQTPLLSELAFETHLWAFLQALHEADRHDFDWAPHVSRNPNSTNFAMSIAGSAYFVVGLHPGSSRLARRAPLAAVAFNPHSQFRHLKQQGLYARLRDVIRERDVALQGDLNPMLADHGDASEAAQYSGRRVFAGWQCPFQPRPRKQTCLK